MRNAVPDNISCKARMPERKRTFNTIHTTAREANTCRGVMLTYNNCNKNGTTENIAMPDSTQSGRKNAGFKRSLNKVNTPNPANHCPMVSNRATSKLLIMEKLFSSWLLWYRAGC